jgi:hypothetical protein
MNLETAILLVLYTYFIWSYWRSHLEVKHAEQLLKLVRQIFWNQPGGPYLRRK